MVVKHVIKDVELVYPEKTATIESAADVAEQLKIPIATGAHMRAEIEVKRDAYQPEENKDEVDLSVYDITGLDNM